MRAVVGFLERIGFNGVEGNLITYLTGPLGLSTAAAAAGVQLGSSKPQIVTQLGSSADPRQVPREVRSLHCVSQREGREEE